VLLEEKFRILQANERIASENRDLKDENRRLDVNLSDSKKRDGGEIKVLYHKVENLKVELSNLEEEKKTEIENLKVELSNLEEEKKTEIENLKVELSNLEEEKKTEIELMSFAVEKLQEENIQFEKEILSLEKSLFEQEYTNDINLQGLDLSRKELADVK